jgi:hypothetical protein
MAGRSDSFTSARHFLWALFFILKKMQQVVTILPALHPMNVTNGKAKYVS